MNEDELELVVTRTDDRIDQVRLRRGEEYICEILPYLNKYGKMQVRDLLPFDVKEVSLDFKDRDLENLVRPPEELLDEIRTNYLKMTHLSGNYWINTHDKEIVLDRSDDLTTIGVIKFFNRNKSECSAQELYNNLTDGRYNKDDLFLMIDPQEYDLFLTDIDGSILDLCSIDEISIKLMLSDEHGWFIMNDDVFKELMSIIYNKRSSLILGRKGRCPLGEYIKSKNEENNEDEKNSK